MTKNQRKHFLKIWIGCKLFHEDFGLDRCDVTYEDVDLLHNEKLKHADKYIPNIPAFATTKEIFDYVMKNYK